MPGRIEVESGGVDDHPVLDHEDVLAGPVGDVAVVREQDRLVVAAAPRLVRREHRVQVDAGGLRGVRDRVRPDALPGGDHRGDALLLALLAEIGAPGPDQDRDLDRVRPRVHAELAVAEERDRPDVALVEPVHGDRLVDGRAQLLDRVRERHVQEPGRVVEAAEVVGEPEDGGAAVGGVAADALEHAGAVVEPVRTDVDPRVGPVDELAAEPDLLGFLHLRANLTGRPEVERSWHATGGRARRA